jgi:8-oxo-dGTP pyrophosphatase MutT (NUDIX family)
MAIMGIKAWKYWHDIVLPTLTRERPPTIPQAVVMHEHMVLLVLRDNPLLWELPGGNMLPGETPEETVVREVYEETGLQITISTLLGWYTRTGCRAHHAPVYICHPRGGILKAQGEDVVQARYFSLHALPRCQFPWYRPILQHDLHSTEPRPLQRTQHLGIGMVLHCLLLDLASRAGCFD